MPWKEGLCRIGAKFWPVLLWVVFVLCYRKTLELLTSSTPCLDGLSADCLLLSILHTFFPVLVAGAGSQRDM